LELRFHELLGDIVAEGHRAGVLRSELDPELLTLVIGASLHGLLDVMLADPDTEVDPTAAFAVLEDVLLKGITQ
ncbi:MAG: hypothetical protein KJO07_01740, partial [Deltaproteobacteria bacterium]|nr:hypothetical protein [Deltaproteobacteria bacterium]